MSLDRESILESHVDTLAYMLELLRPQLLEGGPMQRVVDRAVADARQALKGKAEPERVAGRDYARPESLG